jgi:hypothetical protein
MPPIPTCQPDGPKIGALIKARGYNVPEFARKIGRPQSGNSLWNIISARRRCSIAQIRQIARGLRVKPGDISDWKGDDDIWDQPVKEIPAA